MKLLLSRLRLIHNYAQVTIWFKDARVYIEPLPDFPSGLVGVPMDE